MFWGCRRQSGSNPDELWAISTGEASLQRFVGYCWQYLSARTSYKRTDGLYGSYRRFAHDTYMSGCT
jgi:hypothetical protein